MRQVLRRGFLSNIWNRDSLSRVTDILEHVPDQDRSLRNLALCRESKELAPSCSTPDLYASSVVSYSPEGGVAIPSEISTPSELVRVTVEGEVILLDAV